MIQRINEGQLVSKDEIGCCRALVWLDDEDFDADFFGASPVRGMYVVAARGGYHFAAEDGREYVRRLAGPALCLPF